MVEFFPPILDSRTRLLTFHTNCTDGSHFALMGFHFAQITTPNPCSLLSSHTPLSGICTYTKYLKTPLFLESGQNEPLSGQFGPLLGKMFEKWAKLF